MREICAASAVALCIWAVVPAAQISTLPGTQPLTWEGDLSERMMDGAHRFVERKIAESIEGRQQYWNARFRLPPGV